MHSYCFAHYLGVSQREPKFKIALHFCLRSVTNRRLGLTTHASLCVPVVSAHAHVRSSAHGKKWWIYLERRPLKEPRILWFLLRSDYIQMHKPFAVDPHWKFLSGLYERSICERTFLSEPIENHAKLSNVNHAKNKLHKHYRVFRRGREPSRIPIRTLERLRNKNRKVREFFYKTRCVVHGRKRHCGSLRTGSQRGRKKIRRSKAWFCERSQWERESALPRHQTALGSSCSP